MFFGSIIAGTAGFGMGMTASPFMLLVLDPRTVVVISNAMGIAVSRWCSTSRGVLCP